MFILCNSRPKHTGSILPRTRDNKKNKELKGVDNINTMEER